jgi:hypothetical protein
VTYFYDFSAGNPVHDLVMADETMIVVDPVFILGTAHEGAANGQAEVS